MVKSDSHASGPTRGFALFAKGFRPFFLAAALFATLAVPAWVLLVLTGITVTGRVGALDWHSHEMLFGFTLAVVAGFLLTAVSNWTSRETARGGLLAFLLGIWILGRVAMLLSYALPIIVVAAVELSFIPLLGLVLARPLLGSANRRNYAFLALLGALWVADIAFFVDLTLGLDGGTEWGLKLALNVFVIMIVIVAGRVVPMFTRNWTGDDSIRGYPLLDHLALASVVLVALGEMATLPAELLSPFAMIAAIVTALRTLRWRNKALFSVPLLWILHVGYLWIPVGMAARALLVLWPASASFATHAHTVGAIGALTLGMMVRVSLGHTGRKLIPNWSATVAFVLMTLAVVIRLGGFALATAWYSASLIAAGAAFSAAFALFLLGYSRILITTRIDGAPG